jgi:hypothetical protein
MKMLSDFPANPCKKNGFLEYFLIIFPKTSLTYDLPELSTMRISLQRGYRFAGNSFLLLVPQLTCQ